MDNMLSFLEILFSETDIEKVLKNIIFHIKDIIKADRTTLFIYNPEENILESIIITGENITKIKLPINKSSIAGYTFLKDKIINIKDAYNDNELKSIDPQLKHDKSWDVKTGYKTKSILAIPIKRGSQKLGVLELINKEPYFTKEDEEKLKEVSKFIAIAIENALNISKIMQKQKEEKVIIENIAEAVAITDLNLNLIEINASFMEMIGYRYSLDEIKNYSLSYILEEFKDTLEEKARIVKEKYIPTEINLELIKIKITPVIVSEFGEEKLKKLVFIFKYPKG